MNKVIGLKAKYVGIFYILKILHLTMKMFGLFPFKVKHSKKGFKLKICYWGAILTVFHVLTYTCGYILVIIRENQSTDKAASVIIQNLQTNFALFHEGLTVIIIFASIVITKNIQNNMLKLLNRIECILRKESLQLGILHIYLISCLVSLHIIGIFVTGLITLIVHPYAYSFMFTIVRVTPHLYIFIKVAEFVLYLLLLNLGFNALNDVV